MGEGALIFALHYLLMTMGIGKEKETSDLQQRHKANVSSSTGQAGGSSVSHQVSVTGGWELGTRGWSCKWPHLAHLVSPLLSPRWGEYPKATPTVVNLPCVKSEKPAWAWAQWMTQTIT